MVSKIKIGIITLSIALIMLLAYLFLIPGRGQITTSNAYVQGEITPVSAEVSGRITRLRVNDNQYVKVGEPLLQIDDRDYQARYQQSLAELAAIEANLRDHRSRQKLQKIKIEEVVANQSAVNADHHLYTRELQRYQTLSKSGAVSLSMYDSQANKAESSKAKLKAAQSQLSAAKQQLITLDAEYDRLIAQQQRATAQLEQTKIALEKTRIIAPVSGIIGNRTVQQGKFVNTGTPLLSIVPVNDVWLVANYKETQLTKVQPGQQVEVILDLFPDQPLQGTVLSIAPSTGAKFSLLPPDNATGNFVKVVQRLPVKIQLTLPDELVGRVVPGLSARSTIHTAR